MYSVAKLLNVKLQEDETLMFESGLLIVLGPIDPLSTANRVRATV